MSFIWDNEVLESVGDIYETVNEIIDLPEREGRAKAKDFMATYRRSSPIAAEKNLGYLSGLHGGRKMLMIQDWFGVQHVMVYSVPELKKPFEAELKLMRESEKFGEKKS